MLKITIKGKPLKPCPFCGCKKISLYDNSVRDFFYGNESYIIECDRCNANIERYSETGVKRAWNRRITEQRPHGEWVKRFDGNEWYWYCTSCKEKWYEEDLYIGGNDFPDFCPKCGADMRKRGGKK